MKNRISDRLIAALVALMAISSLTLVASPSGAIRYYTVKGDIACKRPFANEDAMYAVIAYGAWNKGLRCKHLHTESGSEFKGVGDCTEQGDGICQRDDVNVIQASDLDNASADSDCLSPKGGGRKDYHVGSACAFGTLE